MRLPVERVRQRLVWSWYSGTGLVALILLVFGLFMATIGEEDILRARPGGRPVVARITEIGLSCAKYAPCLKWVAATDDKNLPGQAAVPGYMIAGCKVGDAIPAERAGIVLTLQPMPCRRNLTGAAVAR